jgi:hypothetical protein
MRRALILALLGAPGALGVAGGAYGATGVTNVYTMHAKIRPAGAGATAHSVPVGAQISYDVSTNPPGSQPDVVKTLQIRFQGIKENTNRFPACGTATLSNAYNRRAACPRRSKVATGHYIVELTPQDGQAAWAAMTCRVELSIFNGGDHTLTYYVYTRRSASYQLPECPLARNEAFVAALTIAPRGLVDTVIFPQDLLHPTISGQTYDAAIRRAVVKIYPVTRIRKGRRIGLLVSTGCPPNHEREVAATFTKESGESRTAKQLIRCRY